MTWTNLHTHSWFSDGSSPPEEYVAVALEQGLPGLGFSDHAPLPFPTDWSMPLSRMASYALHLEDLQEQHIGAPAIFKGLEIDFIPGVASPRHPRWDVFGLDYRIGSVHYAGEFDDGSLWTIDGDDEEFERGVDDIFDGSIPDAVCSYYALVREMVRGHCPDIIAHLDVIKKNNTDEIYFRETDNWYRKEIEATLEVIARAEAIVEVNLGGLIRKRSTALYPSRWILERMHTRGIPVTISSDAHQPQQIVQQFDEAAKVLLEIGFSEIVELTPVGWRKRPLETVLV